MPRITFIHPDGSEETIDVEAGTTLMQAATINDIDGIIGECGGAAMCATCHVYVEPQFVPRLKDIDPVEDEMLDSAASPRQPNSRLGCQILVEEALDGIRVRLPISQA